MKRLDRDAVRLLPAETIHACRVVPLELQGNELHVGVATEPSPALLRDLAFTTGKRIIPVSISEDELAAFLEAQGIVTATQPLSEARSSDGGETQPLPSVRPKGSVVQQVHQLVEEAIQQQASDIHIEPYETFFRVRFRLDGVLHAVRELSLLQRDALISRLKVMASLDIAEKRRPQDGRIRFEYGDRHIDIRVSTLPTDHGEKVVLRILDKSHLKLQLEALGFDSESLTLFRRAIHEPYGMILVSGPTGSGKTTTLYAALNELNREAVNITTIEDPIEYNLPGINQTNVRSDIGFTFAQALRAFLRQDPNIIMVGEIRDTETAEIAIRAALTGHLVLSTIHTNDAPSTVTRLVEMGIEPYLVASSLRLSVAQRLVRRICPACKEPYTPDPAVQAEFEGDAVTAYYTGRGCGTCNETGYQGRTALFEVMQVDDRAAERISGGCTAYELRERAVHGGMRTLRAVGVERMRKGYTTPEEILRETSV